VKAQRLGKPASTSRGIAKHFHRDLAEFDFRYNERKIAVDYHEKKSPKS